MWGPVSQEEADSERTWNVSTVTPLASGAIQIGIRSLRAEGLAGLCAPSLVRAAPSFPEGYLANPQPDRNLPARGKGAKENSQVLQTGPCLNFRGKLDILCEQVLIYGDLDAFLIYNANAESLILIFRVSVKQQ